MLKIALTDYFKEHVGCLERMVAAYVIGFSVTVDFVLPCTTEWETPGGFPNANRETLIMYRQVVEPFYEARLDSKITGACTLIEPKPAALKEYAHEVVL